MAENETVIDTPAKPVEVSANTGIIDGAQAAARYVSVILLVGTAFLGLLKTRDVTSLAAFIQQNLGEFIAAVAGLIGLAVAAYGVLKSRFRGAQIATVAADKRVPDEVAKISGTRPQGEKPNA